MAKKKILKGKNVVKYRKHGEIDFSGSVVRGKAKAPEIFYIFQRKRTKGGDLLIYPKNLSYHKKGSEQLLKEYFSK